MAKTESYREALLESLRDPEAAAHYLTACLEDQDPRVFLLALRDVADAHGGLRKASRSTGLNRENLYRMLSRSGNPALRSLESLLESLGLKLAIQIRSPMPASPSRRLAPRELVAPGRTASLPRSRQ